MRKVQNCQSGRSRSEIELQNSLFRPEVGKLMYGPYKMAFFYDPFLTKILLPALFFPIKTVFGYSIHIAKPYMIFEVLMLETTDNGGFEKMSSS